jgi:transcriptional regulator with XRE-family HTH domain
VEYDIKDVAQRLKGLRLLEDISTETAAQKTGVTTAEFEQAESGEVDISVTFLYKCAELYGVDIVEILTGDSPKLQKYAVVRKNEGLQIERRAGFEYRHLAHVFKDKGVEPLHVHIPYCGEVEKADIPLNVHEGQEFDYVLSGSMRFVISGKEEILHEGDSVYYNSSYSHGMTAYGGKDCDLLVVLSPHCEK